MHRPYAHEYAGLHGSMVNPSETTAIKKMDCPSPNIPQLSVASQLGMEPPKSLPPSMLECWLAWFCTRFCECNGSDTSRKHCFAPLAFIVFHGGVSEPGREGIGFRERRTLRVYSVHVDHCVWSSRHTVLKDAPLVSTMSSINLCVCRYLEDCLTVCPFSKIMVVGSPLQPMRILATSSWPDRIMSRERNN